MKLQNNEYLTIIIYNNGRIDIKLLDIEYFEIGILDSIINKINNIIKKTNKYTNEDKLLPIIKSKNMEIVTFDAESEFSIDKSE